MSRCLRGRRAPPPSLPLVLALGALASLAPAPGLASEPRAAAHESYAHTPEALVPFGRGREPHHRFFREPQAYRGPRTAKAPRPADEPWRVGLLLPSPASSDGARGIMMRRGVELAFEEAGAGRAGDAPRLELVVKEDAPLWGSAANGMVELCVRDRVLAVIGSVEGAASHVALRVALKANVFMVNTATTDPTLTETAIPWLLRNYPDDRQHAYRLAELMVRERGLRRLAVLRSNDRYGRMGIRELLDGVRRLGAPVLQEMRFVPGERDLSTQVARLRAIRPDGIVLWGDAADLGHAARTLREAGVEAPLFGPDRLVDPAFLAAAGAAAEGTTATSPLDPTRQDRSWQEFRARFLERFGVTPDAFAAHAFDGARLLLGALEEVGPDRVRLRDRLAAVTEFDGVTGHQVFDPTHNNLAPLHVVTVRDGRFRYD